ncbi:unnamed protein product [Calicophoron daubneyi]|uniref:Cadherin domain-containing protein n=1 Tax=Calicophoron daubneyi TaxID=300641 RepID=A0AAV2SZU6_CALDB
MAVCIAFALILTTCLLGCKSALQPKSAHNDLLLKAMNYSIAEEVVVPLVLGNLVTDLGLTEFMLSVDVDKPSPRNTSKQTLSIDLIANAGQVTSDDLLAPGLPQIQIFPSNQWGWKYFRVRHKSLLTQELILTKSIDRDQMCQLVEDRNSESTDSCTCYPRPCPVTDDEYSYCEFTLTVAVYPLQPGMPIYAIRILLKDINDNAPTFQPTSSYVLSFKENDKPGTSRQLPIATDPDMCSAGDVQYSLRPQSETDQSAVYYFRLHSTNVGKETAKLSLVLIRPLDREHQDQYGLYVLASDRAITRKRRTSTLTLLVLVEDANDCRPEFVMPETMQSRKHLKDYPGGKRKCLSINETATTFQHQPIIIKIPENAPIGYLVKQIVAEDGDAGVNGKVQYSLGPRTNPVTKRLFTLDSSTGELRVSGQLDRENTPLPNGFHRITVIASDQGNPPRSSTLRFLIYLMDTNDNRPQIRLIGEKQALVSESLTEETTRRSRALWHLQPVFSQWVNPLPESWQSMNDSVELVGRQNPGAVLASIVVDDLDMGENGTVSCRIEGQLIALHENADRVGQKLQATTKSVVKLKQLLMYQDQSMNSTDGNTLAVKRVIRARRQVSPDEEKTFAWNVTQEKSYTLESVINYHYFLKQANEYSARAKLKHLIEHLSTKHIERVIRSSADPVSRQSHVLLQLTA